MIKRQLPIIALGLMAIATVPGCGLVGDTDRLPMARIGERIITRGDMRMTLRMLPPEEKPVIATKGDVRSALNDLIDRELKKLEAERLEASGDITVDEAMAEQMFFANHPDIMDVREVTDPTSLPVVITPAELENLKQSIAEGIEQSKRELLANEAIRFLIYQAFQTNRFEISDAEWEREYRIQKAGLFHPPRVTVKALGIPVIDESASGLAADFRRRVDDGEPFDAVYDEFVAKDAVSAVAQEMVYDSTAPHLRTFWEAVQGSTAGSLFGPVSIPQTTIMVPDGLGGMRPQPTPQTFLVGKVEEYVEPVQKTLEESKPDLAASVLYVRVLEELRQRYDVEIFEENLYTPDVSGGGGVGPLKPQEQSPGQPQSD